MRLAAAEILAGRRFVARMGELGKGLGSFRAGLGEGAITPNQKVETGAWADDEEGD